MWLPITVFFLLLIIVLGVRIAYKDDLNGEQDSFGAAVELWRQLDQVRSEQCRTDDVLDENGKDVCDEAHRAER